MFNNLYGVSSCMWEQMDTGRHVCFLPSAILIFIFNEKVPSSKKLTFWSTGSVRQSQRSGYVDILNIILSNFHAFKNRKFMMKFLVGSYTLWFS